MSSSDTDVLITLALLLLAFCLYFLPALIGRKRGVCGAGWLTFLNLFTGWTVLGWIVLLLWAVAGQTRAADAYYRRLAREGRA